MATGTLRVIASLPRCTANTAQLLRAVGALKPPSSAVLAVQRGSDAMTLSVPVAKRPPIKPRDVDDGR